MFKKKAGQKVNFDPKIALRTERFDPAGNSYLPPTFKMLASSVVGLCATVEIVNSYIGEAGGSAD